MSASSAGVRHSNRSGIVAGFGVAAVAGPGVGELGGSGVAVPAVVALADLGDRGGFGVAGLGIVAASAVGEVSAIAEGWPGEPFEVAGRSVATAAAVASSVAGFFRRRVRAIGFTREATK